MRISIQNRWFIVTTLASLIWLLAISLLAQTAKTDEDQNAIASAKKIVGFLTNCPRREIVGEVSRGRWVKEAWGPPENVSFDVEKTNSIVHPYKITVQFSLMFAYGPKRKTSEEAHNDTELKQLLRGQYRNIYDLKEREAMLATTQVEHGAEWEQRPKWNDACWDVSEPIQKSE